MTREDEILNSMREQREDAYHDGLKQGLEQGCRETAVRLKGLGVSGEIIAQATGLSLESVLEL